jgi:hypothetical protein
MGALNPDISGETTKWQKIIHQDTAKKYKLVDRNVRRTVDTSQKVLESANMILY